MIIHLTNFNNYGMLILSAGERLFYCQNRRLAGRGLNRFLVDTQESSFLLEEVMPSGIYDRTKSKPNLGMFKKGHKPSENSSVNWFKKGHPQYEGAEKGWFKKGHTSWCKGKKLKPRSKISIEKQIKSTKRGEKHRWWKGGLATNDPARYKKEWYHLKPNGRRNNQKRLALKKAGGELTVEIIQQVYEDNIKEFGTLTCIYCFKNIQFGGDSLEHIIPLTRGGKNNYENLAIACQFCNTSKSNKLLEEWIYDEKRNRSKGI